MKPDPSRPGAPRTGDLSAYVEKLPDLSIFTSKLIDIDCSRFYKDHSPTNSNAEIHHGTHQWHAFNRLIRPTQIPPRRKEPQSSTREASLTPVSSWKGRWLKPIPRLLKSWYVSSNPVVCIFVLSTPTEEGNSTPARVHPPHRLGKCHLQSRV